MVVLLQSEQLDINVDLVSFDKHTLNQIYESISSQVIHVNSGTRVLLSIHASRHLIFFPVVVTSIKERLKMIAVAYASILSSVSQKRFSCHRRFAFNAFNKTVEAASIFVHRECRPGFVVYLLRMLPLSTHIVTRCHLRCHVLFFTWYYP